MKKIIKISILVILFSLLIMSIIIPGDLKANYYGPGYEPGPYPGIYGEGSRGPGCFCPFFCGSCTCYMVG